MTSFTNRMSVSTDLVFCSTTMMTTRASTAIPITLAFLQKFRHRLSLSRLWSSRRRREERLIVHPLSQLNQDTTANPVGHADRQEQYGEF